MSRYGFAIKTAADLLAKAQHDAGRFNSLCRMHNAGMYAAKELSYAALDSMQTAWHVADWIADETGVPLDSVRDKINQHSKGAYFIVGDLACGQKHYKRTGKRNPPQSVYKSTAPPPVSGPMIDFDTLDNDSSPLYVIDIHGQRHDARTLINETLSAIRIYLEQHKLI